METRANILIVDDDEPVRLLVQNVLRQAGFRATAVDSAHEALSVLEREWFDLVITDKNMADVDGHTLIKELWIRHPQVGTVMMTGFHSPESEGRAREQRVLAYLEKPIYDLRAIPQVVQAALDEQQRRLGLR
jgi:DNA-binding NtrC family response regulator